ncbi:hypothetical protein ACU4GD_20615 [Cupriavidus basilensis]
MFYAVKRCLKLAALFVEGQPGVVSGHISRAGRQDKCCTSEREKDRLARTGDVAIKKIASVFCRS